VGVVRDSSGRFLLEKRPDTGLLAGFYQLKQVEYKGKKHEKTFRFELEIRGFRIEKIKGLGAFKHVFTHRIWEMEAFDVQVDTTDFSLNDNEVWVNDRDFGEYSIAICHQRILENL
jgi:A/G-specific adenine glycosylase